MNLKAATSLTAWLWAQQPDLIYSLVSKIPRQLGQCLSCDADLFAGCNALDIGSCSGLALSDPTTALDLGTDTTGSLVSSCFNSANLPTLTESDLTQVDTSAVDGGTAQYVCGGGATTSTDASTSSALQNVANFLTSGAGLSALANVASSYFKAQAASSQASAAQAQMQAAILNAQTARAATGQSALPVSYVANSNGSVSPVISTTGGKVPLSSQTLNSLTPSGIEVFLAQYGTWLLVGGAALFVISAAAG